MERSRDLTIRLPVYRGDTGSSFLVDGLSQRHTVQNLKERIERDTNLPAADQILLCENGTRLDNNQALELYGLGVAAFSQRLMFDSWTVFSLSRILFCEVCIGHALIHVRRTVVYMYSTDVS